VDQASSPLGLISVVSSPTIPFRHVPGLSLAATTEPPAQLGVFTDGDGPSVITAFDGRLEPLAYLDATTSAAPYHLLDRPRVLVLGAGGGADVLQAAALGARAIDGVELDGNIIGLVRNRHRDFAGDLYRRPEVRVHRAEARAFVAGSPDRWDLIQIPLLDSLGAAAAGVHSLSESYVYTVEAFRAYLRHLRPGGVIAITRWLKLPPRDALKLFATARAALAAEGARRPETQLALLRGWNTTTLLVKQSPFTDADLEALGRFAEARFFDLAYAPGLDRGEANRFNLLDQPFFHDGAAALAGPGRDDFIGRYKFDIRPTRDDRPYFSDFFRWRSLPEILDLRARGSVALLEWGYPILFATLAQAAALSALLILLPLRFLPRSGEPTAARWRILIYFTALGLAFLFIEIAFIQRFTLFLGHPLYAVAVVLAAFLIFAGAGSGGRRHRSGGDRHRGGGGRLSLGAAGALRPSGRLARARQGGGFAGPDRALGVLHGAALSARPGPGLGQPAAAGALGLGGERLRLGDQRGPGHGPGDPFRIYRGRAARRRALPAGRRGVPQAPARL
jgi:spermidine synthase